MPMPGHHGHHGFRHPFFRHHGARRPLTPWAELSTAGRVMRVIFITIWVAGLVAIAIVAFVFVRSH